MERDSTPTQAGVLSNVVSLCRLGAGPVVTQQYQEIVDVHEPITIQITGARLWAIYTVAVGTQPVTHVADAIVLGGIHDASACEAARPDIDRRGAFITTRVRKPIAAGVEAFLFPSQKATITQTTGSCLRALVAVDVITKPLSA